MTEAEEIDKQMRAFSQAVCAMDSRPDLAAHLDEKGSPAFSNRDTQLMFMGWVLREMEYEAEKAAPSFAYKLEIVVVGDPCEGAQLITTAIPDMSPAQWHAVGKQLQRIDEKQFVNIDDLFGEEEPDL